MREFRLQVPEDFSKLEQVWAFVRETEDPPEADEYVVDFNGPRWVRPLGMLLIGRALDDLQHSHPYAKFSAVNATNDYAAYMGFYATCCFEKGNPPGTARGSETYVPITILATSELQNEARAECREIGPIVERRAKALAGVLLQRSFGPAFDAISYSLLEILRNVFEHSDSKVLAYCAQYWPTKRYTEIALLDEGMGIRRSLSTNPNLSITNNRDALNLALMPGVSGKMYKGIRQDPNDVWQNAGYGLYAVSRLCGHDGAFFICSGDTGLELSPEGKKYHRTSHPGTALALRLNVGGYRNFSQTLGTIINEGKACARRNLGQDYFEPSNASTMLSVEFRGEH
jgi:hypothetical protein